MSVDRHNPDGTVTKQNVFEHKSFVETADIKIEDAQEKVSVTKDGILNLTQHSATDSQVAAGVHEPSDKGSVQGLLTFKGGATSDDIKQKAEKLADLAKDEGYGKVMIGGAGYLMKPLETALSARGIEPVYAFSERRVTSTVDEDGKTQNKITFEHLGFVEVQPAEPESVEKGRLHDDANQDADNGDAAISDSADNSSASDAISDAVSEDGSDQAEADEDGEMMEDDFLPSFTEEFENGIAKNTSEDDTDSDNEDDITKEDADPNKDPVSSYELLLYFW